MEIDGDNEEYHEVSEFSCRVCLENESKLRKMIWIWEEHDKQDNVAGLYRYCTGLEVQEEDNFPQYVCSTCFTSLEDAAKIKKISIESHLVLKTFYEKSRKDPIIESSEVEVTEEYISIKDEEVDFVDYIDEEAVRNEGTGDNSYDEIFEHFVEKEVPIKPIKTRASRKQLSQPQSSFFCEICNTEIHTGKHHHINMHKKSGLLPIKQCETCHKHFYFSADLSSHSCQPILKTCDSCGISFDTIDEFKKHLEDFHFEDGFYRCEEPNCGFEKRSVNDAYYHIKWHKNPIEKICHVCGMKFSNPRKFSKHKTMHIKNVPMICDLCGVAIIGKTNLFRHFKAKHLKIKYFCEFCPKSYSDKMVLKAHTIRCHDMEAKFSCDNCGQRFLFQSQLNSHNNKMRNCSVKTKSGRETLEEKIHRLTCSTCGKSFTQEGNLLRHYKNVHLNIRRFACEHCGKSFSQKTAMETHTRIHTGEKPFQCKFCEVRYSDRSTLHKHLKNHHLELNALHPQR